MVPALVQAIKAEGIVLVTDQSAEVEVPPALPSRLREGIDGMFQANGVLRFHESIDI